MVTEAWLFLAVGLFFLFLLKAEVDDRPKTSSKYNHSAYKATKKLDKIPVDWPIKESERLKRLAHKRFKCESLARREAKKL